MVARARGATSAFAEHCEPVGVSSKDREAWLAERRNGIGGSDASTIMGANPYESLLSLYADKTGQGTDTAGEVAHWGNLFEAAILREYGRRVGRRVVTGGQLLRSKRASHHRVTLDGVQFGQPPQGVRGPGLVEIKTTGYGQRYDEDIPVEVQIQIQWQLWITQAEWATCVWLPFPLRKLQWRDVFPHREFQLRLAEKVDEFWGRVQTREPPDPDGSAASTRALYDLYPEATEEVVRLECATEKADEYEGIAEQIKALDKRKAELRNEVAFAMRESKYAVFEDGRYWVAGSQEARDVTCPHCDEVLSKRPAYRTYSLRKPRKKPFPEAVRTARLEPTPDA